MANLKQNSTFNSSTYPQLSGALSASLRQSPTAYTPNTQPTLQDLRQQTSLMGLRAQAEQAQQAKLKQQVYGKQPSPQMDLNKPIAPKEGPIVRGLNALASPLYAITGGIQALTGTGAKPGLENVFEAVRTHQTSGDTLRKMGIENPWITMPLGFAMDVALDPINWLASGTDAMIPKLASGLQGGGEGVVAAAKSIGAQKLSRLANMTPFIPEAVRGSLGTKAIAAEDIYRALVNKPTVIEDVMAQAGKTGKFAQWINQANPEGTQGQKLAAYLQRNFEYSPNKYHEASIAEAKQLNAEREASLGTNEAIAKFGGKLDLGPTDSQLSQQLSDLAKGEKWMESKNAAEQSAFNPPAPGSLIGKGSSHVMGGMKQEASDIISEVGQGTRKEIRANLDKTGVKGYDNFVKWVNSSAVGRASWKTLGIISGFFKIGKVPLNYFTAYVNAAMSDSVMVWMFGQNLADARFIHTIYDARNIIRGRALSERLAKGITPEINKYLTEMAGPAEGEIGLTKKAIDNSLAGMINKTTGTVNLNSFADLENIREIASRSGQEFTIEQIKDAFNEWNQTVPKIRQSVSSLMEKGKALSETEQAKEFRAAAAEVKGKIRGLTSGMDSVQEQIAKTIKPPEEVNPILDNMTTFISHDVLAGPIGGLLSKWDEGPEGIKKFLAGIILKSQANYNSIDQTVKIGAFLHWTINGVSGPELRTMSSFIKLKPNEVFIQNGFYHLTPDAAMRGANEVAMNYAAMPNAIKVLRNMPILGSPFISFSYGMAAKTAKTVINNPGFLNRVTFARNEISRGNPQSPFEKAALGGPYYNYLNRYERVKLPFLQDYPLYLNIANWAPYLSLNFFQTAERKYADTFGDNVMQVLDQLPFLKTPEGQLLFDLIIQPHILNIAHPTGQFGQELYPQEGTAGQKASAITQDIISTYLPNWAPGGFRFKQLVNAVQGKSSQGIKSPTGAPGLFLQWASSMMGAPIAGIDLQNVSSSLKKQISPPKAKKTSTK